MNQDTNREDRVELTESQKYRAGIVNELINEEGLRICMSCGYKCDPQFDRFCHCAMPELS